MKRTNPKKGRFEDPRFVAISWDEAPDNIADRIMDLRNNNETHKYMRMRRRYTYQFLLTRSAVNVNLCLHCQSYVAI